MKIREKDRELAEFRDLMKAPGTYDDGFTWQAFIGALFVAMVMVPGAIYMALIAGTTIGPAAQWVTVILFIEVARRANKTLKKAEIFTLFYLTGAIMAPAAVATGLFQGGLRLLWNQFYVDSSAALASGVVDELPNWVAPQDPDVLGQRSIFMWEWLPAVGLIIATTILSRIDNMVLGYGLFRLTSDVEKLPFPMAPVGAQGIAALSEEQEVEAVGADISDPNKPEARRWRWRVFSIGSAIGLCFGLVYIGIPIITGALLTEPIQIFPIPWVDLTQKTADLLPATAVAFTWDMGHLMFGMVLPFFAMFGSFVGLLVTFVANPILQHVGVLHTWRNTDNYQRTIFKNNIDFYLMFGIGVALSIATVGIFSMFRSLYQFRKQRKQQRQEMGDAGASPFAPPPGRGDIRPRWIIVVYLCTTSVYIALSCLMLYWFHGEVHRGVLAILLIYGFLYTPLISYATARLEGIAGQVLNIPFVREAGFILSGYTGAAVWFLPMPLYNYGMQTVMYRQAELTGTKFWSIWKAEVLLTPIIIIAGLLFANIIWGIADIPGPQYPYAQEMWELLAENQSVIFSSTLGQFSEFEAALRFEYILWGGGLGLAAFGLLAWLGVPTFFAYGVVRGLGQSLPHMIILEFAGAMLGRFYFQRRLGLTWRQYIPVVVAGFSCGVGLIGTLGVGVTFLVKSVFQLPL
jgi:hypothetical protein